MEKTCFIIGASSGIGYSTAQKLTGKGYTVYNGSRRECRVPGVTNLGLDVSDIRSIESAVESVLAQTGKIDALIYCAGCSMAAPLEKTEAEDYRYLFEVNFFGLAEILKRVIPSMREQGGGRVIAISSMGALQPIAFDPFYSASKAAVNMLIRELAIELNEYNIYLTSLMPGGTTTEFTRKRKIYSDGRSGGYARDVIKSAGALAEIEQGGMSPDAVAESIIKILGKKKPPVLTAAGIKNKIMAAADKIMPEAVSSELNKRQYLN